MACAGSCLWTPVARLPARRSAGAASSTSRCIRRLALVPTTARSRSKQPNHPAARCHQHTKNTQKVSHGSSVRPSGLLTHQSTNSATHPPTNRLTDSLTHPPIRLGPSPSLIHNPPPPPPPPPVPFRLDRFLRSFDVTATLFSSLAPLEIPSCPFSQYFSPFFLFFFSSLFLHLSPSFFSHSHTLPLSPAQSATRAKWPRHDPNTPNHNEEACAFTMAERKAVSDLARLSSRVVRILGQNPGMYTLNGTNTYLVTSPLPSPSSSAAASPSAQAATDARPRPGILIDTGEGVEAYLPLLERALYGDVEPLHHNSAAENGDGNGRHKRAVVTWISDIILTHRHNDHINGLPSVLSLLLRLRSEWDDSATTALPAPRIHKLADPDTDSCLIERLHALPSGLFTSYSAFDGPSPLWPLKDGDVISVPTAMAASSSSSSSSSNGGGGSGTSLQVVHTPGHTADHICLLLQEDQTFFSGDHVLGSGTAVFEDLNAYLGSLSKCISLLDRLGPSSASASADAAASLGGGVEAIDETVIYPGHGPVVQAGKATLQSYLAHRMDRERQVLQLLSTPPPTGASGWTISSLVSNLYSAYPEHLFPAAARGLLLLLQALSIDNPQAGRKRKVRPTTESQFIPTRLEAGKEAPKPAMPKGEAELREIMDIEWALVPHEDEAAPPSSAAAATANGAGGHGERL
ncbi:hypothetical protein ACQY0O_000565 [Thecaphora frezii]